MRSRSLMASAERKTSQSIGGFVCALLPERCARRDPAKPIRPGLPDGTQVRKSHQPELHRVEAFQPLPEERPLCSYFHIISPRESDVNPPRSGFHSAL